MSLTQRLEQDMKAAMKNKDKAKLGVIRMLRSAIKNMEIERAVPWKRMKSWTSLPGS